MARKTRRIDDLSWEISKEISSCANTALDIIVCRGYVPGSEITDYLGSMDSWPINYASALVIYLVGIMLLTCI